MWCQSSSSSPCIQQVLLNQPYLNHSNDVPLNLFLRVEISLHLTFLRKALWIISSVEFSPFVIFLPWSGQLQTWMTLRKCLFCWYLLDRGNLSVLTITRNFPAKPPRRCLLLINKWFAGGGLMSTWITGAALCSVLSGWDKSSHDLNIISRERQEDRKL